MPILEHYMNHYFIDDLDKNHEYREINFSFNDENFTLITDKNVFSNRRLDDGTRALIKVLLSSNIDGSFLDLGAGYGPIGLTLKKIIPSLRVTLSDVNGKCISLINENKKRLGLDVNAIESDSFQNIKESFDVISLNSPISCGKKVCYQLYQDAKEHLNENGRFYLVIRKDKGALSHIKYLSSLFPLVSVIYKEKGYYCILAK